MLALRRYALNDHVLLEAQDMAWLRLDSVAMSWIFGTISLDLQDLVRTHGGTARQAWVALEGQFLGNAEYRALQLDATFRTFVQGDLSVGEYCRRMKSMADALHDLGDPVSDRVLVLNVLRGLSSTYDHLKAWIAHQRPFPTFLQVRDDLALEEITRGLAPGSSSPTPAALVATPPASSAAPATSLLGAAPAGQTGGGGGRGRRRRRGGGGGTGGPASGVPVLVGAVGARRLRRLRLRLPLLPLPLEVRPGNPSATHGQGASRCGRSRVREGGLVLSSSRRPCSLALLHSSRRPGPRPLSPASSRPGLGGGTRPLWRSPSAPWD